MKKPTKSTCRIRLGVGGLIWLTSIFVFAALAALFGKDNPDAILQQYVMDMRGRGGERIAMSCIACHDLSGNKNMSGPPLIGVMGRRVGSVPGFEYSNAMRESNIVWGEETLTHFLKAPEKMFPGTKMSVSEMSSTDIAELVAYFKERQ